MDLIPSFSVDHTKIVPGIYVSRIDKVGKYDICTYDIRMKYPNKEPAISPVSAHTIEHIIATYLRNDDVWKDRLIYWGPMGCLTGFYMITKKEYSCEDVKTILLSAFYYLINDCENVPGTKRFSVVII